MKPKNAPSQNKPLPLNWSGRAYLRFWGTLLIALGLDQWTKYATAKAFVVGNSPLKAYTVIDSFFYIVHVRNTGAAWGFLSGYGLYLALLGAIVLIGIYLLRRDLGLERSLLQYAFGFLTAGIIGNVIDRLVHGYVIDFIDIYLPGYHWPTFNIADTAITIGVGLYLIGNVLLKPTPSPIHL